MSRVALVVGINNYRYEGLQNLNAPAANAEAIAQRLEEYGNFRVIRLPQAISKDTTKLFVPTARELTLVSLEKTLEDLFCPDSKQIPDTALFYFSGHGLVKKRGEGFLATSDTDPNLGLNGLPLTWLRKLLQDSPIKQQIVLLDCWHGRAILNVGEANAGESGQARNRCFIAASRDFKKSYQALGSPYSVLTKAILDGLDSPQVSENGLNTLQLSAFLDEAIRGESKHLIFNRGEPIPLIHQWDAAREQKQEITTKANSSSRGFMKEETAKRRIQSFRSRFGEAHIHLAYHAAFPLSLTPDLVYRIWANFQRDCHGESLNIPWIAVSDLILSGLCNEVGYELYEIDNTIRNNLLSELKADLRFGSDRIEELSDFLLTYVRQQLESSDPDVRDFAQSQRWTALAYTNPSQAVNEIALMLSQLRFEDRFKWIRMASITETFAQPLADFKPLLLYLSGMSEFARGSFDSAAEQLRKILHTTDYIEINGVRLTIPKLIYDGLREDSESTSHHSQNDLLTQIYNAFDPFAPLPAGDPAYVDCAEVRGDTNILVDLGNKLLRSDRMVCQLYAGHRGSGKSTELLRLKEHLEKKGCFVVYFAADENDIDPEDAQYVDILLSCTRHLLEELKNANPEPILGWLGDRWQDLKELALTEIKFEDVNVEAKTALFAKLTTSIRAIPSERQKIRDKLNPHSGTLLHALNGFIDDAKRKLPKGKKHLVVIADNFDRIVPIPRGHGRNTHDEIFLDRAQQLQALNCHIIYTIPISMVYSNRAEDLRVIYGDPQVLPMIMVETPDGKTNEEGLAKITKIIKKRIEPFAPNANLETEIFSSAEGLQRLCLMSGGHVRNLMLLVRSAIDQIHSLPITEKAIQRGITQARDTYRRTVEQDEWEVLAKISVTKQIDNDDRYRKLLFNRCVLQYGYLDDEGEIHPWYDVHPLIKGIPQFKDSFETISNRTIGMTPK